MARNNFECGGGRPTRLGKPCRVLRCLRRNALLRTAARARPAVPLPAALHRTLATGLPMSADFTVRRGGALVLVAVVARLGLSAVAAYAIAYKVMYVATMAFYAVRQAARHPYRAHPGRG